MSGPLVVNAVAGVAGAARGSRVDRRTVAVAARPPLGRAEAGTGTVGARSRVPPKFGLAARRAYRRSGVVPAAIGTTPSDTSRGTGDGDVEASASTRATRTADAPASDAPAKPTAYVSSLVSKNAAVAGKREVFFEESYDIAIREYLPSDVKIDVQSNGVRFKVTVETDSAADLVLHWGVASAKAPDAWTMPPASILPAGTAELSEVCQTPLSRVTVRDHDSDTEGVTKEMARVVIEGSVTDAPHAINFVLHDKQYNQWYHQQSGDFFRVLCPALPEPEEEEEEALESGESGGDASAGDAASSEEETSAAEADALATAMLETPIKQPKSPEADARADAPKGIASLLGTLSGFRRTADVKKEKEKKAEAEEAAAAAAAATAALESDFDDDEYQLPEKESPEKKAQKRRVAALLQARAAGKKDASSASSPAERGAKWKPRIGLFGLKPKKAANASPSSSPKLASETSSSSPSALPEEVAWFSFHDQAHTVFTEVDVHTRVGILVDVESDAPGASARVRVETDLPGDTLLLHWGVVPRGARADMWTVPAPPMRPEGSKVYGDKALQTPMTRSVSGLGGEFSHVELDMGSAPGGLRFVIKEKGGRGRWFDNYGGDFVVPLPEQALSSSFVSPPSGRAGVAAPPPGVSTSNAPPARTAEGSSLEEAQLALGGAAAATFAARRLSGEKIDAHLEECIRLASVAFEAAREATKAAEAATAAAKGSPEDGVASTKARRLIAKADEARQKARATARSAQAAALRAQADEFDDPSGAAAAAAEEMVAEATEAAEMASRTWAGETAEISDETLQRWRDDMELAVTKEAEAQAAEAEAAAVRMREQFLSNLAEQERREQEQRAAAEAEAEMRVQKALEAEAERLAAEAKAQEARADAAASAARLKESEQKLQEIKKRKTAEPPAWLQGVDPSAPMAPSSPASQAASPAVFPDASRSTGAPPLPTQPGFESLKSVAPGVPVPATPDASAAPAPDTAPPARDDAVDRVQTPTGNGRELLIQGFNWESARKNGTWYRTVTDLAPRLKELGFTTIWLPPPTDSVSEEGYMPQDLYNLDSKYGSMRDLRACVAALHDCGIKSLGDAVLNHRCAGLQGPDGLWNQYTGKLAWDARAIVSDDPHFGGKGNASSGDFFHAAPNIDHSQDFVKRDIVEWMRWLQAEVGYDGWRLDYVRGFSGTHVKTYMESTDVHFAVGEYWDTLAYDYDQPQYNQDSHRQRIVNWIDDAGGLAGAFDVTTKGILHAAFERQEYWRLSDERGQPPGVLGSWPSRAVTFIENHDTGSTQGHWRFPGGFEEQGYVYILTHPGTPTIFWDHMFEWEDDPGLSVTIEKLIRFREERGVHSRSQVKILKAEQSVYAAQIDESLVMKIGPGAFSPGEDDWEYHTHGNEWCVWRRRGT